MDLHGDTVLFDGVREWGSVFNVGTAVFHPRRCRFPDQWAVPLHDDRQDAVELGQQLKPRDHRSRPL